MLCLEKKGDMAARRRRWSVCEGVENEAWGAPKRYWIDWGLS
jgi:hypothetical protein